MSPNQGTTVTQQAPHDRLSMAIEIARTRNKGSVIKSPSAHPLHHPSRRSNNGMDQIVLDPHGYQLTVPALLDEESSGTSTGEASVVMIESGYSGDRTKAVDFQYEDAPLDELIRDQWRRRNDIAKVLREEDVSSEQFDHLYRKAGLPTTVDGRERRRDRLLSQQDHQQNTQKQNIEVRSYSSYSPVAPNSAIDVIPQTDRDTNSVSAVGVDSRRDGTETNKTNPVTRNGKASGVESIGTTEAAGGKSVDPGFEHLELREKVYPGTENWPIREKDSCSGDTKPQFLNLRENHNSTHRHQSAPSSRYSTPMVPATRNTFERRGVGYGRRRWSEASSDRSPVSSATGDAMVTPEALAAAQSNLRTWHGLEQKLEESYDTVAMLQRELEERNHQIERLGGTVTSTNFNLCDTEEDRGKVQKHRKEEEERKTKKLELERIVLDLGQRLEETIEKNNNLEKELRDRIEDVENFKDNVEGNNATRKRFQMVEEDMDHPADEKNDSREYQLEFDDTGMTPQNRGENSKFVLQEMDLNNVNNNTNAMPGSRVLSRQSKRTLVEKEDVAKAAAPTSDIPPARTRSSNNFHPPSVINVSEQSQSVGSLSLDGTYHVDKSVAVYQTKSFAADKNDSLLKSCHVDVNETTMEATTIPKKECHLDGINHVEKNFSANKSHDADEAATTLEVTTSPKKPHPCIMTIQSSFEIMQTLKEGWLEKKGTGNDWRSSTEWKFRWACLALTEIPSKPYLVPSIHLYWYEKCSKYPCMSISLESTAVVLGAKREDSEDNYIFEIVPAGPNGKPLADLSRDGNNQNQGQNAGRPFAAPLHERIEWVQAITIAVREYESLKWGVGQKQGWAELKPK